MFAAHRRRIRPSSERTLMPYVDISYCYYEHPSKEKDDDEHQGAMKHTQRRAILSSRHEGGRPEWGPAVLLWGMEKSHFVAQWRMEEQQQRYL